jgi:uncharacterized membrane protein YhiD involved in acid resistance
MIAQTLDLLLNEIASLWAWGIGIIAGWGITLTLVVIAVVLLWRRQNQLEERLEQYRNIAVMEGRDASLRLNRLETRQ